MNPDTIIMSSDSIATVIDNYDCIHKSLGCCVHESVHDSASSGWIDLISILFCIAIIALISYAIYKIISNIHKIKTMWMELLPRKSEETGKQEKTYSILVLFAGLLLLLLIMCTC